MMKFRLIDYICRLYYFVFNGELYHAIRNRFRRYDLIRTGLNKYKYYEIDERMLYGMMSLLVFFIEREKSLEVVDWDYSEELLNAKSEMLVIYNWWKDYPNRLKQVDKLLDELWGNGEESMTWYNAFKSLKDEEDEMMTRLIKIRYLLII
jgi:hypothetical protein